jgi:hypothetical protein
VFLAEWNGGFLIGGFRLRQGYGGTGRFGSVTVLVQLLVRRSSPKIKILAAHTAISFLSAL